jgi:hypothetical protein
MLMKHVLYTNNTTTLHKMSKFLGDKCSPSKTERANVHRDKKWEGNMQRDNCPKRQMFVFPLLTTYVVFFLVAIGTY